MSTVTIEDLVKLAKEHGFKEEDFYSFSKSNNDNDNDNDDDRILDKVLTPVSDEEYDPFEFENPAEMFLFKENIKEGHRRPHKWQAEVLVFLGQKENFTISEPLRLYLQTCNGSGKDSYITALFAVWLCACNPRSRFVCTSSSNTQLELQTESYIRTECEDWNNILGEKIFLIKKHHIVCTLTKSEIVLFSTNEPGRAEGWHPFPDYKDSILALVINEAKTVDDEIFKHLRKCTGYRYWLEISSPGSPSGHFYNNAIRCREWSEGYNKDKIRRKVTAFECPHIPKKEVVDAVEEYGENDPLVQNTYFAEFSSANLDLILPSEILDKVLENPPEIVEECEELPLRVGIDLGIGGDESTMYCFKGNYCFKHKEFRIVDTTFQRDIISKTLIDWGFEKDSDNIFIDDGNIGHSVADMLIEIGWNIQRVLNQSSAANKKRYGNRGAEIWWNFRSLVEHGIIRLPKNLKRENNKLYSQLISRYFKQRETQGTLILESKKEARSRGHGSPDRADGVTLANCRIYWKDIKDTKKIKQEVEKKKLSKRKTSDELVKIFDNEFKYKYFNETVRSQSKPRGSLQCLLKNN